MSWITTIVFVLLVKGIFSTQDSFIVYVWIVSAVDVLSDERVVSQVWIFFLVLWIMGSTSSCLFVTFFSIFLLHVMFSILLLAHVRHFFVLIDISNNVGRLIVMPSFGLLLFLVVFVITAFGIRWLWLNRFGSWSSTGPIVTSNIPAISKPVFKFINLWFQSSTIPVVVAIMMSPFIVITIISLARTTFPLMMDLFLFSIVGCEIITTSNRITLLFNTADTSEQQCDHKIFHL